MKNILDEIKSKTLQNKIIINLKTQQQKIPKMKQREERVGKL